MADAAVVPVHDEVAGELPIAFIVKSPTASGDEDDALRDEIHLHVNESFAAHKHLAGGIEFVEALAKSASGKTQRKILKDLAKSRAEARRAAAAKPEVEVYDFDSDEE